MARYALINDATKVVVNVIELEVGANWAPPEGHSVVKSNKAGPGDTYVNRKFVKAPEPTGPTEQEQMQAEYAAATASRKLAIIAERLGLADGRIEA